MEFMGGIGFGTLKGVLLRSTVVQEVVSSVSQPPGFHLLINYGYPPTKWKLGVPQEGLSTPRFIHYRYNRFIYLSQAGF